MAILSNGNIEYLFNNNLDELNSLLSNYDYHQLKEFTEADILSICNKCKIETISLDFEHLIIDPRQEKGQIYNYNKNFYQDSQEYLTVEGKRFYISIKIKSGSESINYGCDCDFTPESDKNYENMDSDRLSIFFSFFIPDYDFKGKDKNTKLKIVMGKIS